MTEPDRLEKGASPRGSSLSVFGGNKAAYGALRIKALAAAGELC